MDDQSKYSSYDPYYTENEVTIGLLTDENEKMRRLLFDLRKKAFLSQLDRNEILTMIVAVIGNQVSPYK